MNRIVLLIFTLVMAQGAVADGIYKWVDAEGGVHYGARPPAGGRAQSVTVKKAPPPDPGVAGLRAKEGKLLQVYDQEHQEKQQAEAKASQEAAKRKRNCNIARDDPRMLKGVGRVYQLNDQGKRVYLSDAQKRSKEAAAQRAVAQWCDGQ